MEVWGLTCHLWRECYQRDWRLKGYLRGAACWQLRNVDIWQKAGWLVWRRAIKWQNFTAVSAFSSELWGVMRQVLSQQPGDNEEGCTLDTLLSNIILCLINETSGDHEQLKNMAWKLDKFRSFYKFSRFCSTSVDGETKKKIFKRLYWRIRFFNSETILHNFNFKIYKTHLMYILKPPA